MPFAEASAAHFEEDSKDSSAFDKASADKPSPKLSEGGIFYFAQGPVTFLLNLTS
jgi:hypothetical protein